ncbi:MAG: prepilin-type N-terminal cleavage/methylation domain-containing protein [bacterium]
MKIKDNKGFTLIELLLVILIIIGLAAIVVPNYMKVSDDSASAVDAANREALKAATRLMVLDVGLSGLTATTNTSADLNTSTTATNFAESAVAILGSPNHGPYVDPVSFPVVKSTGGSVYVVRVNTTTGSILITAP